MRTHGEGDDNAELMAVGEASGVAEEASGRVFCGKAGRELDRLLRQADIGRRDIWLTNVVKQRPLTRSATGNNAPTPQDIKRDEPELIEEIARVRPSYIAALGAVAARWFLRDHYDSIEAQHALPFPLHPKRVEQCRLSFTPWVIVATHPAAGLHQQEPQKQIYDDIQAIGKYLRGELPLVVPVDQYPDPDYREITTASVQLMRTLPIYIDTEGLLGRPWGLSYSQLPGQSAVIRKHNRRALAAFRDQLRGMRVVAHHWIHDAPIIAELLGMTIMELLKWIGGPADDTMVKSYVLRTTPLALKPLCRRYHGMTGMRDYKDVVREAERRTALVWMKRLLRENVCGTCRGDGWRVEYPISEKTGKAITPRAVNCPACEGDGTSLPSPLEYQEYVDGVVKTRRGERAGNRVRRIVRDCATNPDTDPRDRYSNIDYDYRVVIEDVVGELAPVSLDDVEPLSAAIAYSNADSDGTCRSDKTLDAMIDSDESGKTRAVYEIDRDALPILIRMMEVGVKIDVPFLGKLAERLRGDNEKIAQELKRLTGHFVNPDSPKQVRELLFDEMGLPPGKRTPSDDPSTADEVLSDLKLEIAGWDASRKRDRALTVIGLVTDYRERSKLHGTYAVKLPRSLGKDGRVRTEFRATNTESGRYSSAGPNLQNQPDPAKSELGGMIRQAFIADDGYSLVEADYSQMELRFAASDSNDDAMCRVFEENLDLHAATAARMFDVPLSNFNQPMSAKSKMQRRAAKTINFSVLYGITPKSLRGHLKIETGVDTPLEECAGYIDKWKDVAYPGVGMWILEQHAFARRYGYSECMFGRRRYLPGMHSAINSVKAESERIAVNHRDQASCAGIMKKSAPVIMDEVLPYVRRKGWDCDPLLTVHDSFLMRVKVGGEELLIDGLKRAMSGVVELRVPLTVDGHSGKNWAACK